MIKATNDPFSTHMTRDSGSDMKKETELSFM